MRASAELRPREAPSALATVRCAGVVATRVSDCVRCSLVVESSRTAAAQFACRRRWTALAVDAARACTLRARRAHAAWITAKECDGRRRNAPSCARRVATPRAFDLTCAVHARARRSARVHGESTGGGGVVRALPTRHCVCLPRSPVRARTLHCCVSQCVRRRSLLPSSWNLGELPSRTFK